MVLNTRKMTDNPIARGFLKLQEGKASNIIYDDNGQAISWDFDVHREIGGENKICWKGLSFMLGRGLAKIPFVIACGNGSVTGVNAPNNYDVKLNAEIFRARFVCPQLGIARMKDNIITFNALWPQAVTYSGSITEWGLFTTEEGGHVTSADSGIMVSRIAQPYTRTAGTDLQIVWVIQFYTP